MAIVANLSGNYPAGVGGPDPQLSKGHVAGLFTGISATTDQFYWRGGAGTMKVEATWGGGTVKLQFLLPDGVTWNDVGPDTTFTGNGAGDFDLSASWLRVNVATATSVDVEVATIPE